MKKEDQAECCKEKVVFKNNRSYNGGSGAIYGIGIFGALFYFLQNAPDFGTVIIGIGKAIFWPAVLIFKVFNLLKL